MNSNDDDAVRNHVGRERALNFGASLGLICIAVAIVSFVFGITPLVFRSGSMAPEISTGSLAFARSVDANDIQVGDVLSVENRSGVRISHRVVSLEPAGGGAVALTLKGDANRIADPDQYVVAKADRVFAHVPLLGYVAAWLSSKTAIFLGGIIAGGLLMLAFGPLRRPEFDVADMSSITESPVPAMSSEAELQEANRG